MFYRELLRELPKYIIISIIICTRRLMRTEDNIGIAWKGDARERNRWKK